MLDPSILVGTTPSPANGGLGVVSAVDLQAAQRLAQQAEERARMLATALEFQTKLDRCRDFEGAAIQAARLLCEVLPAERTLIAWCNSDDSYCKIVADTDSSRSAASKLATAAAEEVAARSSLAVWPAQNDSNRHSLLALKQFAESISAKAIVAATLSDPQGKPLGAVLAVDPQHQRAATTNFIDGVRPLLAEKLACLQALQPRRWERLVRGISDPASRYRRRAVLAVLGILVAVMLVPVPYNVPAACELQPVKRRFVAAPFDGPLEKVLVRPGDIVAAGDILARINPREIEYELAGLRADFQRADQEKKGLVAEHDFAGSKIAALEAERIGLQTELLEYQRDNLAIRSPLAGVVVSGDLETSEGTPLTTGETLFEIAPLGKMIVEVAIGEEDLAYVRTGMKVEFYLHALPGRTMTGTLKHLRPKAELRDHDNVFVGEVHVDDPDGLLRPGMRGRSWVCSDRQPLGWNLFHKAYFAVRHALGW
jgi:biotin carboxyl carrier protein